MEETKQPEDLSDLTEVPKNIAEQEEVPLSVEKSKKKLFVIGAVIALIIVGAVGFFLSQRKNVSLTEQPTPTPSPTVSPTPSPTPSFIRSDFSFEVLNGSGVTGAAKKIADKLTELGYQVIKTGNADKDNYETTQFFIKKELQDKADLVISDLKDIVKIASIAGELKDSTASARIILGKD